MSARAGGSGRDRHAHVQRGTADVLRCNGPIPGALPPAPAPTRAPPPPTSHALSG